MDCRNCSSNHFKKICRKSDRVVSSQLLLDNYPQNSFNDCRRRQQTLINKNLRPQNLYYDYDYNRQNQKVPSGYKLTSNIFY